MSAHGRRGARRAFAGFGREGCARSGNGPQRERCYSPRLDDDVMNAPELPLRKCRRGGGDGQLAAFGVRALHGYGRRHRDDRAIAHPLLRLLAHRRKQRREYSADAEGRYEIPAQHRTNIGRNGLPTKSFRRGAARISVPVQDRIFGHGDLTDLAGAAVKPRRKHGFERTDPRSSPIDQSCGGIITCRHPEVPTPT